MFTGIVDQIGKIASFELGSEGASARISSRYAAEGIALGASIACDGVCLTVISVQEEGEGASFDVDISPETLHVTTLKHWEKGRMINLERAMRIGDEIGGHIVSGHVDGLAKILEIEAVGDNRVLQFAAPSALARFIAEKGSVCISGTSLTVNEVQGCNFSVNLIPHTLAHTTWKYAKVGDEANLEIDMLARYVARLSEFREV